MANSRFLPKGDFWRICDRTGRKVPASQTRKEWNGLIVDQRVFEARHPQDFVRARREKMGVPNPRLRGVDEFNGPLQTLTTADAAAGDLGIDVDLTTRFEAGDHLRLYIDTGDLFAVILQEVVSTTRLLLARPLPGSMASGAPVINMTAVAADLGWDR